MKESKCVVVFFVVFAFDNTDGDNNPNADRYSHQRSLFPRVNVTNYNVFIDGRNLYDKSINNWIKKYDEIRKISIEQCDDYTTGYLLRSSFSKKLYQLFAIHRRKEIEIDADSKPDQYSNFYGMLEIKSKKCAILEKTKEIEKK